MIFENTLEIYLRTTTKTAGIISSTLDELFEKSIANPETRIDLKIILRYDFKDLA